MEAAALIQVIRSEVEDAAEAMIAAAGRGLRLVGEARSGRQDALDELETTLCAILEACAFQDLTGQRLSRLAAIPMEMVTSGDHLLNGPADAGDGLTQDAADALFASPRNR